MQSDLKESKLYFTPYRVSTITCNADIGERINIDLHLLFKNIEIEDREHSFIWIQYLKEDNENVRGVYPKKKRKSKVISTRKNRFDNQITVIYKYDSVYMPNIKIFKNGNIQLTGIKSFDHTEVIVNAIIENIKRIHLENKAIIITEEDDKVIERLQYRNFQVRMINTDFKIYKDPQHTDRFNIRRKELHNILIGPQYNNKCSFQPGVYQGVKLEYFWNTQNIAKNGICCCSANCFGKHKGEGNGNCKKVTIAIFESGSILITGGITFEQVNDAYEFICKIIVDNNNSLKKQVLSELMMVA